jgi:hypothetical protein
MLCDLLLLVLAGHQCTRSKQIRSTVLITAFGSETGHIRLCKEAIFVDFRILGEFGCLFIVMRQIIGRLILGNNFVRGCGMVIDY